MRKAMSSMIGVAVLALLISGCGGADGLSVGPRDLQDPIQQDDAGGNPFWNESDQGSGEPAVADETNMPPPRDGGGNEGAPIKPVSIITNKIQDGVFGDSYTSTLKASGGNKAYSWSIVDGELPQGLNLKDNKIKGTPLEVGTFTVTVEAADAKDASLRDEVEFSFRIADTIAINATLDGQAVDTAKAVVVPWSGELRVAASGHAPPYTWSLEEGKVQNKTVDGKTVALTAKDSSNDVLLENLAIVVRDALGNSASITFASITFEGDPCQKSMTVALNNAKFPEGEGTIAVGAKLGEAFTATMSIKGGKAPYLVETTYDAGMTPTPSPTNPGEIELEFAQIETEGIGSLPGAVTDKGFKTESYQVTVTDGCSSPHQVVGAFVVDISYPPDPVSDLQVLTVFGEIFHTGNSDGQEKHTFDDPWLSVLFYSSFPNESPPAEDESQTYDVQSLIGKALAEGYYNLAACNDVDEEFKEDTACNRPFEAESTSASAVKPVSNIRHIGLLWFDSGSTDVDVDIKRMLFFTTHWYASYSDEKENCFDDNVVSHQWRFDHLNSGVFKGMTTNSKGEVKWLPRRTPGGKEIVPGQI